MSTTTLARSFWDRSPHGKKIEQLLKPGLEAMKELTGKYDLVFIDAEKDDYESLFDLARPKVEPGALFVADNVLSHAETLGNYSRQRQADPTLVSVTVHLDRGLELSAVLR